MKAGQKTYIENGTFLSICTNMIQMLKSINRFETVQTCPIFYKNSNKPITDYGHQND